MMEESRWQDIYMHLKNAGFDVYSVGQHTGECLEAYVVVKEGISTQVQSFSTNGDNYRILCYVPISKYSTLAPFVKSVESAMKGLEPMIRPLNLRTEPVPDPDVKAIMQGITYVNYRKL